MMAFTTPPPKTPTVHSSIPGSQGQTLLHPPPKQKYRFTPVSGIVTVALLGGASLLSILGSRSAAPSPGIAVTSRYHVGATLAGAADTSLHISGAGFATNSAITFLLDGASAPGAPRAQSTSSGQVQADLKIGAGWSVGKHTLTARDAQGQTAANGVIITVVPQGEAMTPGPHNAPSDSQTFSFTAAIRPADAVTGAPLPSFTHTLVVSGRPDPAGGAVCDPRNDTGQPIAATGVSHGVAYTQTFIATCNGVYKGGKLAYIETLTSYQIAFANGVTCRANVPVVHQSLTGSFTDAQTISGVYSADAQTITCTNGTTIQNNPQRGTWTGTLTG